MAIPIILDTDIGDDIDDALALALICASPELDLRAVTTVFANVEARSRQARTILSTIGGKFTSVPVAAGCGASMASRPMHNNQHYLENILPNQDSTCLPEEQLPPQDKRHAVNLLIDEIMSGDGLVTPVMIGAMTNLATAMTMERRIIKKLPKIVAMAAEFKTHMGEWNILCDPEAASLVFDSGVPIDVTTWDIGNCAQFGPEHVDRLRQSDRPTAQLLSRAIDAWRENWGSEKVHMPSLFDPLAVATMVRPELVEWRTGRVSVELSSKNTYGYTTFTEEHNGPHRVAWNVNREAALEFYLERVLAL